mmetsp:Transcript_20904/g.25355  ORF Transcript_20904/g.25355 Transcript_20904/m.25355 type:complete len:318 (+) Transcript_20904:349-1302(+)|eukprot:CAMPEP_0204830174 /NCGR_PEP_ID=MMETSP1346-20131115/8377_1 /ASSEMBLY_ACC=CAM_ASM_000771 /TAXON_ID=215587 /ORGANISM="Aplanochytrium stocchinoi, Strain GSBS06" /LENGTH=317 /DNA_ID=CAMNT_0051960321 /DNA_START=414 /DNA_END=1367 /DNA_ORIENTATION=+
MGNLVGRDDGSSANSSSGDKTTERAVASTGAGASADKDKDKLKTGTSTHRHSHSGSKTQNEGAKSNEYQYDKLLKDEPGSNLINISTDAENKGTTASETEIHGKDLKEQLNELCNGHDVPMVFRWEGGGKNVYITGTFNQWREKIPMHRSGNDFTYIHELKRGKHAFKFIVDDEWRFAPEQPTVADQMGFINNFVDLTSFERSFTDSDRPLIDNESILDDSRYDEEYAPDPDDPQWYTKEPPQLPPHLRNIILNAKGSGGEDRPNMMQTPQHVTLNHLYCSAIKDNLMVLGVTQRFRKKFITTVFYSPLPEINKIDS